VLEGGNLKEKNLHSLGEDIINSSCNGGFWIRNSRKKLMTLKNLPSGCPCWKKRDKKEFPGKPTGPFIAIFHPRIRRGGGDGGQGNQGHILIFQRRGKPTGLLFFKREGGGGP